MAGDPRRLALPEATGPATEYPARVSACSGSMTLDPVIPSSGIPRLDDLPRNLWGPQRREQPLAADKAKKVLPVFDGFTLDSKFFERRIDESQPITCTAVRAMEADIIVFIEVDNLDEVPFFNTHFIKKNYSFQVLIDSHDPRDIDIGVLSRSPFGESR